MKGTFIGLFKCIAVHKLGSSTTSSTNLINDAKVRLP